MLKHYPIHILSLLLGLIIFILFELPPHVVATRAKDRRRNTSVMEKLIKAQVLPKCNKACPPFGGPNLAAGGGGFAACTEGEVDAVDESWRLEFW
jgi:hypothetical protein